MYPLEYPVVADGVELLLEPSLYEEERYSERPKVCTRYLNCNVTSTLNSNAFDFALLKKEWENCTIKTKKTIKEGRFFRRGSMAAHFLASMRDAILVSILRTIQAFLLIIPAM